MVWFIDKEGKKYSDENISSHVGLALSIMEKIPQLKKEFEESGEQDPSLFLLNIKEWMMGSDIKRLIIYNRETLTTQQRQWLSYYIAEEGYKKEDLYDTREESAKMNRTGSNKGSFCER